MKLSFWHLRYQLFARTWEQMLDLEFASKDRKLRNSNFKKKTTLHHQHQAASLLRLHHILQNESASNTHLFSRQHYSLPLPSHSHLMWHVNLISPSAMPGVRCRQPVREILILDLKKTFDNSMLRPCGKSLKKALSCASMIVSSCTKQGP